MDKPKEIDMAVQPDKDEYCCSPKLSSDKEPSFPGLSFYGKHFDLVDPYIDDDIGIGDEVVLSEVRLRLRSRSLMKHGSDLCFDVVSIKGIGEMGGEDPEETEDDSDSE